MFLIISSVFLAVIAHRRRNLNTVIISTVIAIVFVVFDGDVVPLGVAQKHLPGQAELVLQPPREFTPRRGDGLAHEFEETLQQNYGGDKTTHEQRRGKTGIGEEERQVGKDVSVGRRYGQRNQQGDEEEPEYWHNEGGEDLDVDVPPVALHGTAGNLHELPDRLAVLSLRLAGVLERVALSINVDTPPVIDVRPQPPEPAQDVDPVACAHCCSPDEGAPAGDSEPDFGGARRGLCHREPVEVVVAGSGHQRQDDEPN
mmetsp:Transcript_18147/g.33728  ORF Transcript_18147/g.33728 Transcript_18147/m.33728 type:complete len:257 (-) Transcript_18147:915-1685(-)